MILYISKLCFPFFFGLFKLSYGFLPFSFILSGFGQARGCLARAFSADTGYSFSKGLRLLKHKSKWQCQFLPCYWCCRSPQKSLVPPHSREPAALGGPESTPPHPPHCTQGPESCNAGCAEPKQARTRARGNAVQLEYSVLYGPSPPQAINNEDPPQPNHSPSTLPFKCKGHFVGFLLFFFFFFPSFSFLWEGRWGLV